MPDLNFEIEGVEPQAYAVEPLLNFKLRVSNTMGEPVHSVMLRCQVMFEVARRSYNAIEQERLLDFSGDAHLLLELRLLELVAIETRVLDRH